MLRHEVGDSSFFKILRTYYNDYKYKNASTEDFKRVCENVSQKNMDKFFDQWVYKGVGDINLDFKWSSQKVDGKNNLYITKIELDQVQEDYTDYNFPLDIKFVNGSGQDSIKSFYITGRKSKLETELNFKPSKIIFDPDNWLLANYKDISGDGHE
jgi:aminopeptidase N